MFGYNYLMHYNLKLDFEIKALKIEITYANYSDQHNLKR